MSLFFESTSSISLIICTAVKPIATSVVTTDQMAEAARKDCGDGNVSRKTCWVLKLDIKKFFANIDHEILIGILKQYIPDQDILWLLSNIISIFQTPHPAFGHLLPVGEGNCKVALSGKRFDSPLPKGEGIFFAQRFSLGKFVIAGCFRINCNKI